MEELAKRNLTEKPQKFPVGKQIAFFLVGWLGLQLIASIMQTAVLLSGQIFNPSFDTEAFAKTASYSMLVNGLSYFALAAILFAIANKDVFRFIKTNSVAKSFLAGAICLGCIYLFNMTYNTIIQFFKMPIHGNANEQTIDSIINVYPTSSIIVFGIIGPLVEETTYRCGLFSLLKRKSKVLAYVLTILIFTLIHFDTNLLLRIAVNGFTDNLRASLFNEVLNLPLYAFAAFSFCMTFERHGFIGSASAHVANNLISITAQILIGLI